MSLCIVCCVLVWLKDRLVQRCKRWCHFLSCAYVKDCINMWVVCFIFHCKSKLSHMYDITNIRCTMYIGLIQMMSSGTAAWSQSGCINALFARQQAPPTNLLERLWNLLYWLKVLIFTALHCTVFGLLTDPISLLILLFYLCFFLSWRHNS